MAAVRHAAKKGKLDKAVLYYWLAWAMVIAVLFYGLNRYIEHRDNELNKRLEQFQH